MNVDIDQNDHKEQSHECQRNDFINELNIVCIILIVEIRKSNNESYSKDDDSFSVDLFSKFFQIEDAFNEHRCNGKDENSNCDHWSKISLYLHN